MTHLKASICTYSSLELTFVLFPVVNMLEVKVTQSCPSLCNPVDYTVHGILLVRILDWVGFPSPRELPNPGVEPRSPALQADSLPSELPGKPNMLEGICTLGLCHSSGYCNGVPVGWMAYKLPKFISHSSRGCKSEIRRPVWLSSAKGPLPPQGLITCQCILSRHSESLMTLALCCA